MEPRAHHVLIGLFTVIVAGGALVFALWLGKFYKDVELRYYTVIFTEAVQGLSRGGAVQYNGIKVGDIADLSLDPLDPRKVRARIRVEGGIPIREDTRARLSLTGITGGAVIALSGGTPDSPLLTGKDGQDPVIVATPSPLSQLLANSDNLMSNITELVMNAKLIISPENAQRLASTLESIDRLASTLADRKDDVTAILHAVTEASREASIALRDTAELMRNTNSLVKNQGARTLDSAQKAMASLDEAGATVNDMLKRNKGSIDSGMRGLGELGPALQELRGTLAALRNVTRQLDENPATYLLGRERLQEFQP